MFQAMSEFEFSSQARDLSLVAVLLVEDLQCHRTIRSFRVVRSIHRRVSAVAQRSVDDVAVKLLAGREHIHSLGRRRMLSW